VVVIISILSELRFVRCAEHVNAALPALHPVNGYEFAAADTGLFFGLRLFNDAQNNFRLSEYVRTKLFGRFERAENQISTVCVYNVLILRLHLYSSDNYFIGVRQQNVSALSVENYNNPAAVMLPGFVRSKARTVPQA